MGDINGVKSLNDIINIIKINDNTKITYIPLIQRNYKWSMECAAEFAESIWRYYKNNKVYQLNMITLYRKKEKNNRENKGNLSHAGDVFAVVLFSCDGRILVSKKQHPRSAECGIL